LEDGHRDITLGCATTDQTGAAKTTTASTAETQDPADFNATMRRMEKASRISTRPPRVQAPKQETAAVAAEPRAAAKISPIPPQTVKPAPVAVATNSVAGVVTANDVQPEPKPAVMPASTEPSQPSDAIAPAASQQTAESAAAVAAKETRSGASWVLWPSLGLIVCGILFLFVRPLRARLDKGLETVARPLRVIAPLMAMRPKNAEALLKMKKPARAATR
jgi:hypothetical protein